VFGVDVVVVDEAEVGEVVAVPKPDYSSAR